MSQETVERQSLGKPVTERIWDFFASVKVAIVLIVLIAVSSVWGTLVPQEDAIPSQSPELFYTNAYGSFGLFMYRTGLTRMYTSWWYITLLMLLGISLVVCSLERIVPLYRTLQNQPVLKPVSGLQKMRIYRRVDAPSPASLRQLADLLSRKRYRIRWGEDGFFAEKNRFARFGPYILHIGLILIILGAASRLLPGWYFNQLMWIGEGQTSPVPGTDFSIRNDRFTAEYYKNGEAKRYRTEATIMDHGKAVLHQNIEVNHPLEYKHVLLFQENFLPPQIKTATIALSRQPSHQAIGTFTIDFADPQPVYHVGPYTLRVLQYFPEFSLDAQGRPKTKSLDPINPAFQFAISGPGLAKPVDEWYFLYFPMQSLFFGKDYLFAMTLANATTTQITGLRVHKDLGVPIVYTGAGIVILGAVITFYFQHRRIWARWEEYLHIGAMTNKNWVGIRRELDRLLSGGGFRVTDALRTEV